MINLGFLTEGKLAAIFIKTFSWGFPTGRLFYFINSAPSSFLAPLPGKSGRLLRGEFSHAHPLLCFIVLLYFIYITCIIFISKTQKN
jgi:hypothetical protein